MPCLNCKIYFALMSEQDYTVRRCSTGRECLCSVNLWLMQDLTALHKNLPQLKVDSWRLCCPFCYLLHLCLHANLSVRQPWRLTISIPQQEKQAVGYRVATSATPVGRKRALTKNFCGNILIERNHHLYSRFWRKGVAWPLYFRCHWAYQSRTVHFPLWTLYSGAEHSRSKTGCVLFPIHKESDDVIRKPIPGILWNILGS